MACRALIDPNSCSGHGDCVEVAPEIFRLGDDDIAEVIGNGPIELLLEAAEACPAAAISIVEDTGEQLYP
ncbi:MAG: ferredoxin [Thermoleophilia bacterium]|nr:ferredoxin [Thermoleophilia bacterium]